MLYVSIAFIASAVFTLLTLRFGHLHSRFTSDSDMTGVQKYHVRPVPRVGGIGLVVAMIVVCGTAAYREPYLRSQLWLLLLAGLPAFAGGLAEDLTKNVRASVRLILAMLAGAAGYYLLGAAVVRLDIFGVDWLLQFGVISLICTMIAVGGAANAINIIDGYNGLAAVVSVMILAGLAYVSYYLGDRLLVVAAVGMIGAIAGFLIWNYPRGLIFLGDGGAYFIGFMIGELSILLLYRHPDVSAWFPLLLCIYPVFETLFSIYRKRWLRGRSPGMPDGVHLHMLVYKRLVRWAIGSTAVKDKVQRNAMTSPYLWVLSSLAVIPAVLFWQYQYVLMVFVVLFSIIYLSLYRTLVRFASPRWLMVKKETDQSE
jgi:UDP-N-acetylmuramyl pentapeptide phosphotransferase/UDP-N-acetylglucosamine-1-phosphate transferase